MNTVKTITYRSETGGLITHRVIDISDADKLVTNKNDSFANMPALMPSDEYSDNLTIHNDSKNSTKLHFGIKYNKDDLALLEKKKEARTHEAE